MYHEVEIAIYEVRSGLFKKAVTSVKSFPDVTIIIQVLMTSHGEIDLEDFIFCKMLLPEAPKRQVSSHCILPCPLPGALVVLAYVSLVQAGNFWHQGVIRVGVTQKGAY